MPKTLNDQRLAQILTKVKEQDDSVRAEVSDLKSAVSLIVTEDDNGLILTKTEQ